jgi:hypothetical protein
MINIDAWMKVYDKALRKLRDGEELSWYFPVSNTRVVAHREGRFVYVATAIKGYAPVVRTLGLWPEFDPLAAYPVRDEGRPTGRTD